MTTLKPVSSLVIPMARGVWEVVCGYDRAVQAFSIAVFFLGTLTALSFPFLEPGSAAHTVALLNVSYLVVFVGVILVFRVKCNTRGTPPV